ncbi:MAG TPA: ESX secretion-associated protein EspG [Pseudonocardiaceae bacterium]|nr:ESX secretion-associated protein EspG [Pseudonocardiaceae bacterium]
MTDVLGPALGAPITISTLEFDVLWEHLRLVEMPLVLRVRSPGRTFTERRQLTAEVWRSLEQRGLGERLSVDPRLAHLLRLLEKPDREIDGRFGASRGVRLLVAATGDHGVFALLSKRGLMLSEAPVTGLAGQALSGLPVVDAGPGESITVPSPVLDAAGARSPEDFELALCRNGLSARDAGVLRTMVTGVHRQGQFGASARNQWGHRRRARHVVGFFDTTGGRYLQLRTTAEDGTAWSTVSPADNRLLVRQLSELLDDVTAAAGGER